MGFLWSFKEYFNFLRLFCFLALLRQIIYSWQNALWSHAWNNVSILNEQCNKDPRKPRVYPRRTLDVNKLNLVLQNGYSLVVRINKIHSWPLRVGRGCVLMLWKMSRSFLVKCIWPQLLMNISFFRVVGCGPWKCWNFRTCPLYYTLCPATIQMYAHRPTAWVIVCKHLVVMNINTKKVKTYLFRMEVRSENNLI